MVNSSIYIPMISDRSYMSLHVMSVIFCSRHIHGLNDLCANGVYNLHATSMCVLSIKVHPRDLWSMNELSAKWFV